MRRGSRDFSNGEVSRRRPTSPTKLASREFNQDVGKAKRAAERAPVVITDRGKPAFVLMKYADYERLLGERPSIADLLNHEETKDLDFEPARMRDGWLHAADID
ncbi:MAG TPA: type II toxin-antitoxin system Phd/YefM family antitoxin [Propylenella sp.]